MKEEHRMQVWGLHNDTLTTELTAENFVSLRWDISGNLTQIPDGRNELKNELARSRDEATFLQRYTPQRKDSVWSERNTQFVVALIKQGRMRPRGQLEIDKAKAEGRWDRAYQGQATAQVPEDLQRALDAQPSAKAAFEALKSQPHYHILHQLMIAKIEKTRAARIARFIAQLSEEFE